MSKPEIIIAKTAGFCFGVKRAVQLAFDTEVDQTTYTLGPIIHNDSVIRKLEAKGIHALETMDNTSIDTLIIRAHGVGKAVYEEAKKRDIKVVDATCPYVSKIHKLVNRYEQEGQRIIVVGDKKHPEIIGINGWAHNACFIIKDKEEAEDIQLDCNASYLLVSQTTYKKQVVEDVIKVLEDKKIQVTYIPTICSATTERQEEAECIAQKVDTMFVIGSAYSSNTQKLYEICKNNCPDTYCIVDETGLDRAMFEGSIKIGVTAGASTPVDVIESVIRFIEANS